MKKKPWSVLLSELVDGLYYLTNMFALKKSWMENFVILLINVFSFHCNQLLLISTWGFDYLCTFYF